MEHSVIRPKCDAGDLYVEADGTVHQCCFVSGGYGSNRKAYEQGKLIGPVFQQYVELRAKIGHNLLDLNYNTIENMEKDRLLLRLFNDKWTSDITDGKPMVCALMCGSANSLDEIYISTKE